VLEEAQYLLDNHKVIPDPDERIRRDLRHLRCYAIDNENALEIDDALSIEYLDSDHECRIWIHIADVSRWIRPGASLSLEAERRMTSIYFPDEKISMFPETLSTELLSLGAKPESFAISCGVTIDSNGYITSLEICPSKISSVRRLTYSQLDSLLAVGLSDTTVNPSSNPSPSHRKYMNIRSISETTMRELGTLYSYARIRHAYRQRSGALDEYLRDKTDLLVFARRMGSASSSDHALASGLSVFFPTRYTVQGYLTWNNATSTNLVSEYMILMCQMVGRLCSQMDVPVWYKTQSISPTLTADDLKIQVNETAFLRTQRLLKHLRAANDSRQPGYHATSGSDAYVQCTSPIRRYHDLYNHYRLKSALHAASLSDQWIHNAVEEAGIARLDNMMTADQRYTILNAVKLVTRHRELFWFQHYLEKLVGTSAKLEAVILSYYSSIEDYTPFQLPNAMESGPSSTSQGSVYEVMVLQLGSQGKQYFYHPSSDLTIGSIVRGYLTKCYINPIMYLMISEDCYMITNKSTLSLQGDNIPINLLRVLRPQNSSQQQQQQQSMSI
jgi:hypothetical protein